MRMLKFTADKVFDGYRFLPAQTVLITDEEGSIIDITTVQHAGDDVQHFHGILSPGFVNCHCHLELSHMKGVIAPGTGLVEFVLAVVQQRHLPDTVITEAMEKAEGEMWQNGIVAVGDICNNTLSIPQKSKGNIYYHNFIEASGFHPSNATERFNRSAGQFSEYAKQYSLPVDSCSIVPHAPYSVSDELWDLILHFPGNRLLTIHNQETAEENEWFLQKSGAFTELYERMRIDTDFFSSTGKSSLQSYLPKLLPNQSLMLVHDVFTSEEDIIFSKTIGNALYWCLCPNANEYITGKIPPVELLMKHDCTIVLGTDSLASNHQHSILEEMKTIRKNFADVEWETLLKWGTSNGARALEMDTILGSLEKGKKPGLVLIDESYTSAKRVL